VEELFPDSSEVKTYYYKPEGGKINHESFMETYKQSAKDTGVFILNGGYMVKKGGAIEYTGTYKMNLMDGNWDYFYNSAITWRKVYSEGIMQKELFLDKMTQEPIEKGEYVLWYGPERPKLEFKLKEGIRHGKSTWYLRNGEVKKEEKYKEGILQ
jgi:antitoxin component YwqK of YwqJK toxin-antitoxin module